MNNRTSTYNIAKETEAFSRLQDYMMLVKLRLTSLVVFTALAAYAISAGSNTNMTALIILGLGGFCIVAASNAINQVLEKDFDKLMMRTENRPLAAGRMLSSNAVLFAGFLCLLGITLLSYFNALAAFFGMIAFITYAFVYTPLKRYSRVAVFIGAIAGAMPMLIGTIAFYGSITILGISLFLIQVAWQFPHFWSIAFLGFDDYANAKFEFIPTNNKQISKTIATSSIIYSVILSLLYTVMFWFDLFGLSAFVILQVITSAFIFLSVRFYQDFDVQSAKKLMFSSLLYIPIVLLILLIDKF